MNIEEWNVEEWYTSNISIKKPNLTEATNNLTSKKKWIHTSLNIKDQNLFLPKRILHQKIKNKDIIQSNLKPAFIYNESNDWIEEMKSPVVWVEQPNQSMRLSLVNLPSFSPLFNVTSTIINNQNSINAKNRNKLRYISTKNKLSSEILQKMYS